MEPIMEEPEKEEEEEEERDEAREGQGNALHLGVRRLDCQF